MLDRAVAAAGEAADAAEAHHFAGRGLARHRRQRRVSHIQSCRRQRAGQRTVLYTLAPTCALATFDVVC